MRWQSCESTYIAYVSKFLDFINAAITEPSPVINRLPNNRSVLLWSRRWKNTALKELLKLSQQRSLRTVTPCRRKLEKRNHTDRPFQTNSFKAWRAVQRVPLERCGVEFTQHLMRGNVMDYLCGALLNTCYSEALEYFSCVGYLGRTRLVF